MKKLLYTFFFGYAALKWRRLIRTSILLLILVCFVPIIVRLDEEWISVMLIIAFLTPIVSWIIKPFIVKENQT